MLTTIMKGADDASVPVELAVSAALAAWPDLVVPVKTFEDFLTRRRIDLGVVASAVVQDLYLACACSAGAPGALVAFATKYRPVIAATARRFDPSDAFADEVEQRLNEALFVDTPDTPARIARYLGNGSLAGFVATTARRIALRLAGMAARFQGEEELVSQFADMPDQETLILKARYRETFNRALPLALRQLPRRDRIILRLNLIEHVSTTKLAVMYGVNQSTVSRWLSRAAEKIFLSVKELVCDELDVNTREMGSLLALVRSQIELTLTSTESELGEPPR
jgi:RNA polymerase sigma-70 factor (ECF subfamily)